MNDPFVDRPDVTVEEHEQAAMHAQRTAGTSNLARCYLDFAHLIDGMGKHLDAIDELLGVTHEGLYDPEVTLKALRERLA